MELSTTQQKKLKKLQELKTKGIVSLLEYLFELEDKLDTEIPLVKSILERVKGEDGKTPTKEELLEMIEELMPESVHGEDGKDYILTSQDKQEIASQIKVPVVKHTVKEVVREVPVVDESSIALKASKLAQEQLLPTIPTTEALTTEITKNGVTIRDSLELLQGDDRLDKSAIKGLDEELASIKSTPTRSGGSSALIGDRIKVDDLTAQCDGSTKEFYLTREPRDTNRIMVWGTQFPIILRPNIDFTVSRKVLTLTSEVSAPETGQTLIVQYTF